MFRPRSFAAAWTAGSRRGIGVVHPGTVPVLRQSFGFRIVAVMWVARCTRNAWMGNVLSLPPVNQARERRTPARQGGYSAGRLGGRLETADAVLSLDLQPGGISPRPSHVGPDARRGCRSRRLPRRRGDLYLSS